MHIPICFGGELPAHSQDKCGPIWSDVEIEMKSEIPGVSRAVVIRAGGEQNRKTRRKHEVALAARCSLVCSRCVRDDLSFTVHYSFIHVI